MPRPSAFIPALIVCLMTASMVQAQTINQKVVTFLEGQLSKQVGSGECAHAPAEALRASGGEFYTPDLGADFPAAGDYVWGTLIKVVSNTSGVWRDTVPTAKLLPGDILQYGGTTFVYTTTTGTSTVTAVKHTSVVAAVNTLGMPTHIYEQNFSGDRTVKKRTIDLKKLTAGWVRVYRGKARKDVAGKTKFTLTNRMPTAQTVTIKFNGTTVGTVAIGVKNTRSGWLTLLLSSSSATLKFSLYLPNGRNIVATNAGGYEIYPGTDGTAYIKKLPL